MENNCVFCDQARFAERIIDESGNFNIIATLGQITDGGYVLLAPKEHLPCFAKLLQNSELSERAEMALKIMAIADAIDREYGSLGFSMFEHGIVGQTVKHAHLHFFPASIDFTPRVRRDFPTAEITVLENFFELGKLYAKNPRPYLLWASTFDQLLRVCWDPPAPPQYMRIVTAEFLGRPERANWRMMDPELDKKLWQETVKLLKPCCNAA